MYSGHHIKAFNTHNFGIFSFLFLTHILAAASAQAFFSVSRPLVSIEATLVCFGLSFIYKRTPFFLAGYLFLYIPAVFLIVADVIGVKFGLQIADAIHIIGSETKGIPNQAKLALVVGLIWFVAVYGCLTLLRYNKKLMVKSWKAIILIVALVLYDIGFSANQVFPKDVIGFPNVLGAPIINMKLFRRANTFSVWVPEPKSHAQLKGAVHDGKNVLSISFESLGVPDDQREYEIIKNIIVKSFPQYKLIQADKELFFGGTLSGELRMLCGIKDYGDLLFNPMQKSSRFNDCLPNLARHKGYTWVVGAHANFGGVYSRAVIYPLIGFNKSFFANDLTSDDIKSCKNFQFIACDREIVKMLARHSNGAKSSRYFIHLMTIDSHFPYSESHFILPDARTLFQLYANAIKMTADALSLFVDSMEAKPDYIIISGDHAPPFKNDLARSKFTSKFVPLYVFYRGLP
jgi:hypothetical protein